MHIRSSTQKIDAHEVINTKIDAHEVINTKISMHTRSSAQKKIDAHDVIRTKKSMHMKLFGPSKEKTDARETFWATKRENRCT